MPSQRQWLLRFALGMTTLAACGADERGLSFELGAVGSAGFGAGGSGKAGSANKTGGTNGQGEGGDPQVAGADDGPAGGGAGAGGQGDGPGGSSSGSAGSAAGMGGAEIGGAGSGGSTLGGGGASAGTGGGGTGGEPFISPCGDLNDNRVDDCEETLAQNSRFDTALTGWAADGTLLTQQWVATDAREQAGSGSISVTNSNVVAGGAGNTTLGSGQCLPAWGNERFEVGARAFIKEGQGGGRAAVNLLVFGHDACQGVLLNGLTPDTVSEVGSWQIINGTVKIPPAARSMLVRLVATKPFAQPSLEVLFDDVLVREMK